MIANHRTMGQSNDKYKRFVKSVNDIKVSDPKLIIKQSTIPSAGEGCFAGEFIPKGTVFCRSDPTDTTETTPNRKMNDLLYNGDASTYPELGSEDLVTNIGYVCIGDPFFGPVVYMEALQDIPEGAELSRYYGRSYWLNYDFDRKYPNFASKGEIPDVYVFFDKFAGSMYQNYHLNIFVKCVDGKYYYVTGPVGKHDYFDVEKFASYPIFPTEESVEKYKDETFETDKEKWSFKYLRDVSKPDNSAYTLYDKIDDLRPISYWEKTPEGIAEYAAQRAAEEERMKKYDVVHIASFDECN